MDSLTGFRIVKLGRVYGDGSGVTKEIFMHWIHESVGRENSSSVMFHVMQLNTVIILDEEAICHI